MPSSRTCSARSSWALLSTWCRVSSTESADSAELLRQSRLRLKALPRLESIRDSSLLTIGTLSRKLKLGLVRREELGAVEVAEDLSQQQLHGLWNGLCVNPGAANDPYVFARMISGQLVEAANSLKASAQAS